MAMDALALVECQRITACLESAVEKLGILASLTTDFHNEELNSMLGEEISRIIQEQVWEKIRNIPPAEHSLHGLQASGRHVWMGGPHSALALSPPNTTQHNTTQHNTTQHNTTHTVDHLRIPCPTSRVVMTSARGVEARGREMLQHYGVK